MELDLHCEDLTDEQVKAMAIIARAIVAAGKAVADLAPACPESQAAILKLAEALILSEAAMRSGAPASDSTEGDGLAGAS